MTYYYDEMMYLVDLLMYTLLLQMMQVNDRWRQQKASEALDQFPETNCWKSGLIKMYTVPLP